MLDASFAGCDRGGADAATMFWVRTGVIARYRAFRENSKVARGRLFRLRDIRAKSSRRSSSG
ncbi:hypothetical protein FHX42_001822 [Saccharopolyspora lacisalsi]|uniref:Uncharacterized protein n=1 Tax=Halosaccharopolyspora lacisalsi TaxID=1000566 RepID=A0A839DYM8_9PSEU|nr:hypothetical protein [Halosaccharopolyspora lacisalsi]